MKDARKRKYKLKKMRFGIEFPIRFPEENITRKQHVFCIVLPKFILDGTCYKFMKIEQMSEYLHCIYNRLENNRKSEKNRGKRFFQMIQVHENKLKTSRKNIETKLKKYPNRKNKL